MTHPTEENLLEQLHEFATMQVRNAFRERDMSLTTWAQASADRDARLAKAASAATVGLFILKLREGKQA